MLPIVYISQTKDTQQKLSCKERNHRMLTIGSRLTEERKRLSLTMTAFGQIGGVTGTSQKNYEEGIRYPSAEYLEKLYDAGVDIMYVITGRRDTRNETLTSLEDELIVAYRCLNETRKKNLIDTAHALALVTAKENS